MYIKGNFIIQLIESYQVPFIQIYLFKQIYLFIIYIHIYICIFLCLGVMYFYLMLQVPVEPEEVIRSLEAGCTLSCELECGKPNPRSFTNTASSLRLSTISSAKTLLFNKYTLLFIFYEDKGFACKDLHVPCLCMVPTDEEGTRSLELKLQMIVSCHVSSGDLKQILYKSSHYASPLSHLSSLRFLLILQTDIKRMNYQKLWRKHRHQCLHNQCKRRVFSQDSASFSCKMLTSRHLTQKSC